MNILGIVHCSLGKSDQMGAFRESFDDKHSGSQIISVYGHSYQTYAKTLDKGQQKGRS